MTLRITNATRGTELASEARAARSFWSRLVGLLGRSQLSPGEGLVMHSVAGPFPMRITYEFADREGGAVARIRVEGDAGGFYAVAAPLLRRKVRRSVEADLATLKGLLERRGGSA